MELSESKFASYHLHQFFQPSSPLNVSISNPRCFNGITILVFVTHFPNLYKSKICNSCWNSSALVARLWATDSDSERWTTIDTIYCCHNAAKYPSPATWNIKFSYTSKINIWFEENNNTQERTILLQIPGHMQVVYPPCRVRGQTASGSLARIPAVFYPLTICGGTTFDWLARRCQWTGSKQTAEYSRAFFLADGNRWDSEAEKRSVMTRLDKIFKFGKKLCCASQSVSFRSQIAVVQCFDTRNIFFSDGFIPIRPQTKAEAILSVGAEAQNPSPSRKINTCAAAPKFSEWVCMYATSREKSFVYADLIDQQKTSVPLLPPSRGQLSIAPDSLLFSN